MKWTSKLMAQQIGQTFVSTRMFTFRSLFIWFCLLLFNFVWMQHPRADEHNNKDRNAYDDVIINGDGVPKTNDIFRFKIFASHLFKEWQFPQTAQCPVSSCYQEFESRSSTIEHYRLCHAKYIVWCNDCNRGISVKSHDRFYKHCQGFHPDFEIPSNWRKYLVRHQNISIFTIHFLFFNRPK